MTPEERLFGRKLDRLTILLIRLAAVAIAAMSLVYIGGAIHDAFHRH